MVKFGYRTTALQAIEGKDLTGYNSVVTGANSGIGVETVRALAHAGSHVILCSRDQAAGEKVAEEIRSSSGCKGKITVKTLDLSDFASIKGFADGIQEKGINILILNAGVMACPLTRTKQGFEMQIGVNHLGGFYLTKLLLPLLKQAATPQKPSRVVAVSSSAHRMGGNIDLDDLNFEHRTYSAWGSYGQSKLANILFAKELAKRMEAENTPILAYSLHPGVIRTNLQRHMGSWTQPLSLLFSPFMKSIPQGASTTIVAATGDGITNGAFLADCNESQPNAYAQDEKMATALWELSDKIVDDAASKL